MNGQYPLLGRKSYTTQRDAASPSISNSRTFLPWILLQKHAGKLQWGAIMTWSIFSKILTLDNPIAHWWGWAMGCVLWVWCSALSLQCWKLGQFAMPKTCGNCLSFINNCVYYAHQTHEIYKLLTYSVNFKAPGELWNPLSKTVLHKCSFIWNKGPINIWNDRKTQKWLVHRTCKYFC